MVIKLDAANVKKIYENIPVYTMLKEKKDQDIEQRLDFDTLPIIERKQMIEMQVNCIASEYFSEYLNDKLKMVRTSGSSGQYLEIYWNTNDYTRSMLELWFLRARFYKIYPSNRLLYFFTENGCGDAYISDKNQLGICK